MQRQARAARTQPFGAEAFEPGNATVLRWLGMAGFLTTTTSPTCRPGEPFTLRPLTG